MESADLEPLVEWLRAEYPDSVRVVAFVTGTEWSVVHAREEVLSQYPNSTRSEIAQDVAIEELPGNYASDLYRLGTQRATVRVFDEGTVVVLEWGDDDVLVSLDAGADPGLRSFVAEARDRLPE